ncbi:parathyroid hormone/parathyroid hormone-related peptide receptor-like isoform X2 [Panonychus citri]|uniref:parathyroid hormone/parathyroid hormone-related peptide receptor-like isoform X2 n=1 Tax=Panonychus citri TaxID=50023 RepID=UPI002307F55C|nr:parathyroid hormone/parathyroid hormone-related peptide receptor-like isoform X2 [Panonychus citri]
MDQPVFEQSTNHQLINLTNSVPSNETLIISSLQLVQIEKEACSKRYRNTNSNNVCPLTWDGLMCWPETPAGSQARLPCASYISVFDKNELATRDCTLSGTWFIKESTNQSWTDYTRCPLKVYPTSDQIDDHLHHIKLISKIGYSVSLLTLIIAFLILFCNKRLQCPRNHLHLQLFLSFISRSLLTHVKNIFFTLEDNSTLSCKLIIVIWQYSLLANYNWLLMEGLYLHNLVFFNIFNDNSSIMKYIVLGWSLPVIFIIPWIFARSIYEDTNCWVINENIALFWIIRGPITISIILNLIFFINITRVLFLKMFSSSSVAQASRCYKYSKWFKSTLVLVPLFGVHYALLLVANSLASISHTIEIVWLYVDQLFTSFQGFFVALLYCFLNGEVQQEMKKWLRQE